MKIETLEPAFVESAPDQLEEGVLYVSTTYASAMHLCCCGCGTEVITPLSPARWSITFDGETISLWPSVGNWSQPCRSHYIIRKNQVIGSHSWCGRRIAKGQQGDRRAIAAHLQEQDPKADRSLFQRLTSWLPWNK